MTSEANISSLDFEKVQNNSHSKLDSLSSSLNRQGLYNSKRSSVQYPSSKSHEIFGREKSGSLRTTATITSKSEELQKTSPRRPLSTTFSRSTSLFADSDLTGIAADGRFKDARNHSPVQNGIGGNVARASRLIRTLSYDEKDFGNDDSDLEDITPPKISLNNKELYTTPKYPSIQSLLSSGDKAPLSGEAKKTSPEREDSESAQKKESVAQKTTSETPYKLPPRPPQTNASTMKFVRRKRLGLGKPKRADEMQGSEDDTFGSQQSFGSEVRLQSSMLSASEFSQDEHSNASYSDAQFMSQIAKDEKLDYKQDFENKNHQSPSYENYPTPNKSDTPQSPHNENNSHSPNFSYDQGRQKKSPQRDNQQQGIPTSKSQPPSQKNSPFLDHIISSISRSHSPQSAPPSKSPKGSSSSGRGTPDSNSQSTRHIYRNSPLQTPPSRGMESPRSDPRNEKPHGYHSRNPSLADQGSYEGTKPREIPEGKVLRDSISNLDLNSEPKPVKLQHQRYEQAQPESHTLKSNQEGSYYKESAVPTPAAQQQDQRKHHSQPHQHGHQHQQHMHEKATSAPVKRSDRAHESHSNPSPESQSISKQSSSGGTGISLNSKKLLIVNRRPYHRLCVSGSGGSSKVYKAMSTKSEIYAIKRVTTANADPLAIQGYINEIQLLRKFDRSPHIIQLYDSEIIKEKGLIYMVMEFGECDLYALLKKHGQKPLSMNFIRMYWEQMLQAVQTIHEFRIVHSDLKPANFLVVRGSLKLIDFGIAKAIGNDTTNIHREHHIGTVNYMSPEAIIDTSTDSNGRLMKLGRASDIWSLGCILYQMCYGKTPFTHLSLIQKIAAIQNPAHAIKYPEYMLGCLQAGTPSDPNESLGSPDIKLEDKVRAPQDLVEAIKSCLDRNPKTRITIPQLLEHHFLKPAPVNEIVSDTVRTTLDALKHDPSLLNSWGVSETHNEQVMTRLFGMFERLNNARNQS
ncbi:Dual-specificity kinase, spindle pole body (SPB) duplication and spindle checkpoint function [Mycoemilia scoparia]|uniref:Dual-specificity kinase, spindle pole body (SPB) duplication and spindle checkpoint function n=1 Tax=Mycoemilia scoparia TaxID=417184 RepID=A0A9W8A6D9_9FUNG|nr:Dual-specificity kinase, spindle pole body (SPB) duplication and spindle checkpoint function [Mycoemilia scoparia]